MNDAIRTGIYRSRPCPVLGDEVEVFSARSGWFGAIVGQRMEWGHAAHAVNGGSGVMLQLPLDYTNGDVRWPAKHHRGDPAQDLTAELESRRLLVPCHVFDECLVDYLDRYAAVVQQAQPGDTRGVLVRFPSDGTCCRFAAPQVRKWLVDENDSHAVSEWEVSAGPEPLPAGWPGDVLFCSFPLQRGVDQSLLKRFCDGSERMRGVEIRIVPSTHPCGGPREVAHNRGLYATSAFKAGDAMGEYAGCIQSPDEGASSRGQHGQYAIALDTSKGFGRPVSLELDARNVGNETRFINDYRGVAPQPNVRFSTTCLPGRGVWVQVSVIATIQPGDEILVDYGASFSAFSALSPEKKEAPPCSSTTTLPWTWSSSARDSPTSALPLTPHGEPSGQSNRLPSPPPVHKEMIVELYVERGEWRPFKVLRVNLRSNEVVSFSIQGGQAPVKVSTYGVSWRLATKARKTQPLLLTGPHDQLCTEGPPSKRTRGARAPGDATGLTGHGG